MQISKLISLFVLSLIRCLDTSWIVPKFEKKIHELKISDFHYKEYPNHLFVQNSSYDRIGIKEKCDDKDVIIYKRMQENDKEAIIHQLHAHKTAIIGERVKWEGVCRVGANSIIGDDVDLGKNTIISTNVLIGDNVMLKSRCTLMENVILQQGLQMGENNIVLKNCKIGRFNPHSMFKNERFFEISSHSFNMESHFKWHCNMMDNFAFFDTENKPIVILNNNKIMEKCSIGDGFELGSGNTIFYKTRIEDNATIMDNNVIGAEFIHSNDIKYQIYKQGKLPTEFENIIEVLSEFSENFSNYHRSKVTFFSTRDELYYNHVIREGSQIGSKNIFDCYTYLGKRTKIGNENTFIQYLVTMEDVLIGNKVSTKGHLYCDNKVEIENDVELGVYVFVDENNKLSTMHNNISNKIVSDKIKEKHAESYTS